MATRGWASTGLAPVLPTARPRAAPPAAKRAPVSAGELRALGRDLETGLLRAEIRERRRHLQEPVTYLLVNDALHVDRPVRKAATAAAERAARVLGIPAPRVLWFVEATPANQAATKTWAAPYNTFRGVAGLTGQWDAARPGTVAVRVTHDPRSAARTAAHEVKHAWQAQAVGVATGEPQRAAYEDDAAAFAERVLAWWDGQTMDGED